MSKEKMNFPGSVILFPPPESLPENLQASFGKFHNSVVSSYLSRVRPNTLPREIQDQFRIILGEIRCFPSISSWIFHRQNCILCLLRFSEQQRSCFDLFCYQFSHRLLVPLFLSGGGSGLVIACEGDLGAVVLATGSLVNFATTGKTSVVIDFGSIGFLVVEVDFNGATAALVFGFLGS